MAAQFDPRDLKMGWLLIQQEGQPASPLPLEHTAVSGQIIGPVARVRVTQRFGNPLKTPVELEYLFPLPHEAAVVDFKLTVGTRIVRAEIKELEAARRAFQEAIDAGQRAGLLEQRRPNLFSLQIGNVQPGETILCELEYEDRLSFQDGTYEFVFPMGITPRYSSPSESAASAQSADAAIALPGEKIAPVEITLAVDAGVQAGDPTSPSHQPNFTRQDEQHFSLNLTGIPNKDFVLRYPVSGDAIRTASWSSADGDSQIALITLIPPRLTFDGDPAPREFIFVMDRSGSMSTDPMEQAKNALRACLRGLNPQDTFAIQAFDNQIEWFSQAAQAVTQANIDLADRWLDTIHSRGGTEILPAIDAALALPVDAERMRYVVFLTDGAVSADEQAIRKIAKQRGSARIFTFGIGPSVNRFLLDKIAQMGRGTAEFIGANEDLETAITRYQDRVSYPALQDIQLQWLDADGWDTYPETIPDLYVGQPLEIVTRLRRKGDAQLRLTGQLRGQPVLLQMAIPPAEPNNPTLKRLWARARVESLLDQQRAGGDQDSLRQQIISLSLEHRVLTPFTAFVAVDSEVTTGGDAFKLRVSTPLPEGLDYEKFGGTGGRVRGITLGAAGFHAAPMAAPLSPSPAQQAPMPKRYSLPIDSTDVPAFLRKRRHEPLQDTFSLSSIDDGTSEEAQKQAAAPDFASIDERIKWLARTQKIDGSWGDDVEMTAAALLAFVRAGHTTRVGSYRQQVRKAANWLAQAQPSGFAAFAAQRALSELQSTTGDSFVAKSLPAPTTPAERAAAGDASVPLPNPVASLNDLRIVALIRGNASAPVSLKQSTDAPLVQTWLALSKPTI